MNVKKFIPLAIIIMIILPACARPQSSQTPAVLATSTPDVISPTPFPTKTALPAQTSTATPKPSADVNYLWVSPGTDLYNRVVSIDPLNPQRMAYCAAGEINHSLDGGQTWDQVPIDGVSAVAAEFGYSLFGNDPSMPEACLSVMLDSAFPKSFYSVFTTAIEQYGAPPVFYMAFFTDDNGSTWRIVPPPPDSTYEHFGGFWNLGEGSVEALFDKPPELADPSNPVYVQETSDGGETWETVSLSCPSSGPCLRWGQAVSNIPGMGSPLPQEILVSVDNGQTWGVVEPGVELRAPAPNQIVAYSDREVEIISGSISLSAAEPGSHPLRISLDSGGTWHEKPLPPLPVEDYAFIDFPSLQIMPDGSYLSQSGEGSGWFWLPTQDQAWCPVSAENLPTYPMLLQAAADLLWWVNPDTGLAENINLSDITCKDE
jgi:photosystem II stability/assembly factor-like uncharacterized protein